MTVCADESGYYHILLSNGNINHPVKAGLRLMKYKTCFDLCSSFDIYLTDLFFWNYFTCLRNVNL